MARANYGQQWQSDRMVDSFERLGARLALARKAHGETLEEMATKLGVSPATLRRLEAGSPGTSLGMLFNVLRHFGMESDIDKLAPLDERSLLALDIRVRRRIDKDLYELTEGH